MKACAFHPKPPRNRRLNEVWAGNILPFPRKSPDFFWLPYPSLFPSLSARPLTVSFRPSNCFLFLYIRSINLRASSSFVLSLLPSSSAFSISYSISSLSFLNIQSSSDISFYAVFFFLYIPFSLEIRISIITDNSIRCHCIISLSRRSCTLVLFNVR